MTTFFTPQDLIKMGRDIGLSMFHYFHGLDTLLPQLRAKFEQGDPEVQPDPSDSDDTTSDDEKLIIPKKLLEMKKKKSAQSKQLTINKSAQILVPKAATIKPPPTHVTKKPNNPPTTKIAAKTVQVIQFIALTL
jgi:hypothetical protein